MASFESVDFSKNILKLMSFGLSEDQKWNMIK